MSSQTAIAKIFVPVIGDTTNVPADMLALAQSAERSMVPRFSSAAARDAAITSAYRSADPFGGEGLRCYVQDIGEMEFDGAGWVPVGTRVIGTYTLPTSSYGASAANNNRAVPSVDGYTYTTNRKRWIRATVSGTFSGDTVGQQYRLFLQDEAGTFADIRDYIVSTAGGRYMPPSTSAPRLLNPGTHTLACTFSLTAGAGTVNLNALTVTITDEGPGA